MHLHLNASVLNVSVAHAESNYIIPASTLSTTENFEISNSCTRI